MLWIGITGSIGSGKSTVSELLRKQGLGVLDADEIAKSTLASEGPAFRKVIQFFGTSILDREGQINRSALAKIVFSDKKKREFLESIIHPEVRFVIEESKTEYRKNNEKYLFYDVPLLFEKNMEKSFDLVVMVTVSIEKQIERIRLRNKWTEEEIKNRLASQLPTKEKEAKAHILINNDGDLKDLTKEVSKFLQWLETFSES